MDKEGRLMVEAYVDGMTHTKNALASHIMHMANHGIPTREEFIKIRHALHHFTQEIQDRGTAATEEEKRKGRHMVAQIRAYRSAHPDDPGSYADDADGTAAKKAVKSEDAETPSNALPFTVVSGGVDNTSEEGMDINPADHVQAASLKQAVQQCIADLQNDDEQSGEDFDANFPEQYREYVQDMFMMSNDNGDFVAVMPGHLNEDQIFDKLIAARDVKSEDASVQPGGAINDITDIQNKSVHLLKTHGFHVNKVSNAHAEQMGGPVVYMGKKTGAMHQVAEVDPQGMINDESLEDYLANHVHAEDAETTAKQPYNAMTHLTQAANHIRHILKDNADDEAQVEHIIRMAQIILGPKSDHTDAEYRKMLDGLIVILNRFIIVPMN